MEEEKRNIYVLKPSYLNIVFNDLEELMEYKKGSVQYVNATLKRGDNIRLYG
jgi:small nuclear ribonucleoprotein (snRNP)-like protein